MSAQKNHKKRWIIIISLVLVLGLVIFFLLRKKTTVDYTTVELKKGTLIQTVAEVGTVKANKELELNFSLSGRINKITTKVGELVKKGQILMELDLSSLLLKEKEASSNLEVAQANLNKLLKGATPQELAILDAQVSQARVAYESASNDLDKTEAVAKENLTQAAKSLADLESNSEIDVTPQEQAILTAENNLANVKSSSQQTLDNSRNNTLIVADAKMAIANTALDYVSRLLNDNDLKSTFSVLDGANLNSTKVSYNAGLVLKAQLTSVLAIAKKDPSEENLRALSSGALAYLNGVYQAVSYCFKALEATVVSSYLSQTTLDLYKSNVSANLSALSAGISVVQEADYSLTNSLLAYKNNVATATDSLSAAKVNLNNAIKLARNSYNSTKLSGESQVADAKARMAAAREAWSVAYKQLTKIKTSARVEDIELSRAQLAQAQANLDLIKKQESDSQIIAPIDGQVSKINYEIGEQVGTLAALTMLTENNFEIEVDISESDISKIKLQDPVAITFDAFGEVRQFKGQIYFIEPASTVIQGVIYYKVKILLVDSPENLVDIKAGMTANTTIMTNKKEDIFMVPARAVIDKNGAGKFIRLLENGQVREISVVVGISGNDGLLEIKGDGLSAGQAVITFVNTKSN
ncbi:MAG: efflux RND transporter periplasmic adaptor subunit [Patescibacteria group bacterium]